MALALDQACEICKRPEVPVIRRWKRMVPDFDFLRLCAECEERLIRVADDRATTPEDHYRLVDIGRRLVGEVWMGGEAAYWYREPILVRIPPAPVPKGIAETKPPAFAAPRPIRKPVSRKAAGMRQVPKRAAKRAPKRERIVRKRPTPTRKRAWKPKRAGRPQRKAKPVRRRGVARKPSRRRRR